jgi:hypothetical protein
VPIPLWLRFDLFDDTWLFSEWAQRSLPEKSEWMAVLAAEAAAGGGAGFYGDVMKISLGCGIACGEE